MAPSPRLRALLVALATAACVPEPWATLPPVDAQSPLDASAEDAPATDAPVEDASAVAPDCPLAIAAAHRYPAEGDADDAIAGQHATVARVTYDTGRFGRAFVFAGLAASSYVALPPGVGDFGDDDFTLVLWMNSTSPEAVSTVLAQRAHCGGSPPFTGLDLRMGGAAGNLHLEAWTTAGFHVLDSPPGLRANDGRWHQVAIVRRGSELGLNIDGAAVSRTAITGRFTDPTRTPLYLGVGRCVPGAPGSNGAHDGTAWFVGRLDEVGLFPGAASPDALSFAARGQCPLPR